MAIITLKLKPVVQEIGIRLKVEEKRIVPCCVPKKEKPDDKRITR